ncbi:MAG: hypothetical protein RR248_00210 [Clostridia bacterium]
MDELIKTVLELGASDAYLLIGALCCCFLTAIAKKMLINKVKVDVLHTFDPSTLFPYIFGIVICIVVSLCTNKTKFDILISLQRGLITGALSTALYHLYQSVNKKGLKSLLKDDLFNLFYNQLLAFTSAPEQLLSKQISLPDLIGQAQTLANSAKSIYTEFTNKEIRTEKLTKLLGGIIDDEDVTNLLPLLDKALANYCGRKQKTAG